MIETIEIKSFKSILSTTVHLGKLNVFIGANGSGKSNFLEAIGVLSAAANGRVNDESLLVRGVRPGVPKLYKSSFRDEPAPQHITLSASNSSSKYAVALYNPLESPLPDWKYKTEKWVKILKSGKEKTSPMASQSPRNTEQQKERGLAALKAFEFRDTDPVFQMLKSVQDYRIFTPTTNVLRGVITDSQPAKPLGLSGGGLPEAIGELVRLIKQGKCDKKIFLDFFPMITWAKSFGQALSSALPLSPSASVSPRIIRFTDKFMAKKRNELSGYDASEGALHVLFLMALIAHPLAPIFCAVENADQGLNPSLAKELFLYLSQWVIDHSETKQLLLTTHNPLVLDGLLLNDDRIRLFTVDRTDSGHTDIERVVITEKHLEMAAQGWTLSRLWTMGYLGGIHHV